MSIYSDFYGITKADAIEWAKDVLSMRSFYMDRETFQDLKADLNITDIETISDKKALEVFEWLDECGIIEPSDVMRDEW